jgi:hypothetical protein
MEKERRSSFICCLWNASYYYSCFLVLPFPCLLFSNCAKVGKALEAVGCTKKFVKMQGRVCRGGVRVLLEPPSVDSLGKNKCLQVYPEGTHFMIPWFDRPVIYDVRARPNIVESTSGSRDLQMVQSSALCIQTRSMQALSSADEPAQLAHVET